MKSLGGTRAPLQWRIAMVIALGGAAGALLRWAVELEWPVGPGEFPWSTLGINASGCLAMGVLMALMEEVFAGHVYVRPFLAIGVLGGFTTFSTFAVESRALVGDHLDLAVAYVVGTPILAVAAVIIGASVTTSALRVRESIASRRVPS